MLITGNYSLIQVHKCTLAIPLISSLTGKYEVKHLMSGRSGEAAHLLFPFQIKWPIFYYLWDNTEEEPTMLM